MEECKICNLYSLDQSIARKLLESAVYPWEVLPKIKEFIIELGNQLNKDYIRYKLDTGAPANLSSIAGSNYKIATGSLEPNGSATYTLYVWIREGVGNDVLSKLYHGKIVVNGVNISGDPVSEVVLANLGNTGST